MSGRGDFRNLFQKSHILRMISEFEISDHRSKRSSAECSVFFFVDLLEKRRLVEFQRTFEVLEQVLLRYAHHADLQLRSGEAVSNQMLKSTPRTFEFLKLFVVHDLVHLSRDQAIDLGNTGIDGNVHVLGHRQFA